MHKDSPIIVIKVPCDRVFSIVFIYNLAKLKQVDRPLFNHPCWPFAVR